MLAAVHEPDRRADRHRGGATIANGLINTEVVEVTSQVILCALARRHHLEPDHLVAGCRPRPRTR
jgi:hypothetical protein